MEETRSVDPSAYRVLGVRVHGLQVPEVIRRMTHWIDKGSPGHFVTLTNVHSVMEARHNPTVREIFEAADLSVPDGMPLVWIGHLRGFRLRTRVYGPDLLLAFCRATQHEGYKHFFLGGGTGVAEQLADELRRRFPGLKVAGTYAPPYRPLTAAEAGQIVDMINLCAPDVLWVGLGCPKQEQWMYDHRNCLKVPVMAGIGAAFDFFTGRVRQAPSWMRECGLEWLFRLSQEPRRLWRRYLVYNTHFIYNLCLEALGLKSFEPTGGNSLT